MRLWAVLALALVACGDNVVCPPPVPPGQPAGVPPAAPPPTVAPPCTDIVIWMSPPVDCVVAGGVYERRTWPIVGGSEQAVCNFCDADDSEGP